MHTILLIDIILYCILDSKAMKKKISWIHTKENWGGILCCLMNWTKGSRQMLQWGNRFKFIDHYNFMPYYKLNCL